MKNGLLVLWSLGWRVCLLLAAWQLVYQAVIKSPARFAESNLVSNQIRLQEINDESQPQGVLIGPSMIARLSAEKASTGEISIIQMGLDGGHGRLGLNLLEELGKQPEIVIIEGNSLAMAATGNEDFLLGQISEPVFKIAAVLPSVRAAQRPSAVVYSRLKEWKDGRNGTITELSKEPLPLGLVSPVASELSQVEHKRMEELISRVEGLGISWDRVLIVMLPNGAHKNLSDYGIASELQKRTGVRILDLKGHAKEGEYRFTDGLHLDLASGNRVSERVRHVLQNHFSKKTGVD